MRADWIKLVAVACSLVGAGGFTAERAKAYVMERPHSPYAKYAFRYLVEIQALSTPRSWQDGTGLSTTDLVYRPGGAMVHKVASRSYDDPTSVEIPSIKKVVVKNPKPASIQKTQQRIIGATKRLQGDVDRCDEKDPYPRIRQCIADALDDYASRLEAAPVVSEQEVVPTAVREIRAAAAKVRRSSTPQEARAAIREASAAIRKSIDLVVADDGPVRRLLVSQRSIVAEGVETADAKLVRAVGL